MLYLLKVCCYYCCQNSNNNYTMPEPLNNQNINSHYNSNQTVDLASTKSPLKTQNKNIYSLRLHSIMVLHYHCPTNFDPAIWGYNFHAPFKKGKGGYLAYLKFYKNMIRSVVRFHLQAFFFPLQFKGCLFCNAIM